MKRDEYLENDDVSSFIKWLLPRLDMEGSFKHRYVDRRSGQTWGCNSVYNAYEQYRWNFSYSNENDFGQSGRSFAENAVALNNLRNKLRQAYLNSDTALLCKLSCMVLEWGGVSNWNADWCINNSGRLLSTYREGMRMLKPGIADDRGPFPGRFNSGMTKIYSLLLDDFIIYDGRVGAALGYLVSRYCLDRGLTSIPSLIRFPWSPGKETNSANPKNRNPSSGDLQIESISSPAEHARWNLRASWLLKEVAGQSSKFSGLGESLRALEAALFMIGYDLGSQAKPQVSGSDKKGLVADNAKYPLITHGKGHRFRADYDASKESITFSYPLKENGRQREDDIFTLNEIQRITVYLKNQFAGNSFPLANDVRRLGDNNERAGLGMAIRTLPQKVSKAQAASYLGPYLEKVGVFKLIVPRPAEWKLIVEPDEVIEMIKSYHGEA